jgi:hypothetical protein
MNQVALLTAILLMSVLEQGASVDQHKKLVAEIPFEKGETQILRDEQISKLNDARNAVIEAQKNAVVRVIIEGHFDGQPDTDNTRRAAARAAATKSWLQTVGGLHGIGIDDRLGASGENKRVAKIFIEERAEKDAGRTTESPRVLSDIEFPPNSYELRDSNPLWEAREAIRNDVQQKGSARLVIEGHASRNERNATAEAENRATWVKRWFEARPIPNLQLSERAAGSQENKSMVRLIIDREQRQTSR